MIYLFLALLLLWLLWMIFGNLIINFYYSTIVGNAAGNGSEERASQALESQIARDPGNASLRLNAAETLISFGRYSRAEYHLKEAITIGGSTAVTAYTRLSALYVLQDKLLDAVNLLDGAKGFAANEIAALRPSVPILSPAPGEYSELISVAASCADGSSLYLTVNNDVPSTAKDAYIGVTELSSGKTFIAAVAVNEAGLVSGIASGTYNLQNVNLPIIFTDESIENALRSVINRAEGSIYTNDLANIKELVLPESAYYSTLSDLVYLPSLEILHLRGDGSICEFSSLSSLTNLRSLTLEDLAMDSIDLANIENLTSLTYLSLPDNNITTLGALERLVNLQYLNLHFNSIIDISPLSALVSLETLILSQNSLQSAAALEQLTAMKTLDLSGNRLNTAEGLSVMKELQTLNISANYIYNLSAIADLRKLTDLNAAKNQISDVEDIKSITSLQVLDLSSNNITEITALSRLTVLKRLILASNSVTSLGALEVCEKIEYLDVNKNSISTVEPLREHPSLLELHIENNDISSLLPVLTCPNLQTVYAFGNSIKDALNAYESSGITVYGR